MFYTLYFGHRQLAITFGRKRGRPRKTLGDNLKGVISHLKRLIHDRRFTGHPLSRVLRYFFEKKKVKEILGINLAAIVLFTGTIGTPISALNNESQTEITAIIPQTDEVATAHSIRVPLDTFEISQGYHLFHRAIDLNGETGEPVYPLMEGKVEGAFYSRLAYGNYIIINHGSGFKSLYAHLTKILVQANEEVDKNTVIGTVGSTGWATGSHLHLEVYENGQPFNPLTILK